MRVLGAQRVPRKMGSELTMLWLLVGRFVV